MTANPLAPVHPGEILREEFLAPYGLSPAALGASIEQLAAERTPVTPDTALRLARYFHTSPEFWLNLQANYDACG